MPFSRNADANEDAERERAMAVVEKYFDVDITNRDAAMDVLLDNGIEYGVAASIAQDMFEE